VGFGAQAVNLGSDAGREDLEELELVLGGMERGTMEDGEGAEGPALGGVETVADVGLGGELLEDRGVREAFADALVDAEEIPFEDFGTRAAGYGIKGGVGGLSEAPEGECFNGVRDRRRGRTDHCVIDVQGFAEAADDALEKGFAGTADGRGDEGAQGFLDPAAGGDVAGDALDMGRGFSDADDAGGDFEGAAVAGVVEDIHLERGFGFGFGEPRLHSRPDRLTVFGDDDIEDGAVAGFVRFDAEEPEGGLVEGEDSAVLVEGVDQVDSPFDEKVVTLLEIGPMAQVLAEGIVLAAETADDDERGDSKDDDGREA